MDLTDRRGPLEDDNPDFVAAQNELSIKDRVRAGESVTDAIIADLRNRAQTIASAMAVAYGGRSQYSPEDLGHAVAGNVRNNGLNVHGTIEEVCTAVYEATLYEGDSHYPADEPDYDFWLPRMVGAAMSRCDVRDLPYPPYLPPVGGY